MLLSLMLFFAAVTDPWRPAYHFTPEKNWMNDPNGLAYFDGEYHLFFQYNPFGVKWGHMSWGHAVSRDLLRWRQLPVALAEEDGVMMFSGSVVTEGKRMTAIYTGHTEQKQTQNLAFSDDRGRSWKKFTGNPVIDIGAKDFRDPKVVRYNDRWIMAVALPNEHKIRFYSSIDLRKWEKLSDFGPAGAVGGIWECPDLFPLDGKWVLVVNLNPGGVAGGSGGQYFVGDFDGTTFRAENKETLWVDYGRDLYATVSFYGTQQRRVWLGWMSNWQYAEKEPTETWRTAQSLPRELRIRNGRIVQAPVRELARLRGPEVKQIAGFRGDSYEVQAEIPAGGSLRLRVGAKEETVLAREPGVLSLDRTRSGKVNFESSFADVQKAPVAGDAPVHVRVFVDRSSVEVFANDGETTITSRIFPGPESLGVSAKGGVENLRLWPLRPSMPPAKYANRSR